MDLILSIDHAPNEMCAQNEHIQHKTQAVANLKPWPTKCSMISILFFEPGDFPIAILMLVDQLWSTFSYFLNSQQPVHPVNPVWFVSSQVSNVVDAVSGSVTNCTSAAIASASKPSISHGFKTWLFSRSLRGFFICTPNH